MRSRLLEVQQRLQSLSYSRSDLEDKAQAISNAGRRADVFGPHAEVMDTVQRLLDVSRSERGLPPASLAAKSEDEAAEEEAAASPEDTDGQATQASQACTVFPLRVEQPRLVSRPSSAVSSRVGLRLEELGGLRECARHGALEVTPRQPSPRPPPVQQQPRPAPHFAPVRLARPSSLPSVPVAVSSSSMPALGPPALAQPPIPEPSPPRIMGTQVLFKPYELHSVPALPAGSLYAMASRQAQVEGGLTGRS